MNHHERSTKLYNHFTFPETLHVACKTHPRASSIGVCADCLKERLFALRCSLCGERRSSSCYCMNLVCSGDRISILLKNDVVEKPEGRMKCPKLESSRSLRSFTQGSSFYGGRSSGFDGYGGLLFDSRDEEGESGFIDLKFDCGDEAFGPPKNGQSEIRQRNCSSCTNSSSRWRTLKLKNLRRMFWLRFSSSKGIGNTIGETT